MSDDVRQAARALLIRVDGLCSGKDPEWNLPKDAFIEQRRALRAALASGERGEYERGVEDAAKCCDDIEGDDEFVAGCNACAAAIRSLAAPAENDAGRGE